MNVPPSAPTTVTGTASGTGTPGSAPLRCESRGCGRGATSPASWSHAGGPNGPCCPLSRRLTSTASAPGRWTTWFRPWAWKASARVRSPASARSWTRRWPSSATAPLDGEYPYVWLDAKAVKTRENDRVVSMAAVVAVGVRITGDWEDLGFDLGPAETYEF